jgi:hypothetical protein
MITKKFKGDFRMNPVKDALIWITSFTVAILSYITSQLGFRGELDLITFGGFTAAFGVLMIVTVLTEDGFFPG